jgi:hypothetical protein
VRAELFHADRRTDERDKANSGFRNFAETPKNSAGREVYTYF